MVRKAHAHSLFLIVLLNYRQSLIWLQNRRTDSLSIGDEKRMLTEMNKKTVFNTMVVEAKWYIANIFLKQMFFISFYSEKINK